MNHLGLPGGSASPCWVWLDVVAPSPVPTHSQDRPQTLHI